MTRPEQYSASQKSLKQHPLPAWFDDAKLGVIVAWGLYSVPAFAPAEKTSNRIISEDGWEQYFKNTPYAEWYWNSIKIPGSPAHRHHIKTYGESFEYEDFLPEFKRHIENWNPDAWADFFHAIGAKYAVYFTKFHDGFLMWPSRHECPVKKNWYSSRDTVREIAEALRARGLKFGAYYSGAVDWAFTQAPVTDLVDLVTGGPRTREYGEYVDNHLRELIDNVKPDILWNDIAYPPRGDREAVMAYYYNNVADGCVNDRWVQYGGYLRLTRIQPLRSMVNRKGAKAMQAGETGARSSIHVDFTTPEFTYHKQIQKKKFEAILSFGTSVAYNAHEDASSYHSVEQMIRWFCDIIAKNGNLLLVVSPRADGSIPEIQSRRMIEFGGWIRGNSEAIHGSRPWFGSEALQSDEDGPRFTLNNGALYAFVPTQGARNSIAIKGVAPEPDTEIRLLGHDGAIQRETGHDELVIRMPDDMEHSPVHVFRISPVPRLVA